MAQTPFILRFPLKSWNKNQRAQLYGRDYKTIAKHINNALREELEGEPVVAKFATPKKYGRMKPWYVQKVHNPRDTVEETTISR